jgi:hypothetical protein
MTELAEINQSYLMVEDLDLKINHDAIERIKRDGPFAVAKILYKGDIVPTVNKNAARYFMHKSPFKQRFTINAEQIARNTENIIAPPKPKSMYKLPGSE